MAITSPYLKRPGSFTDDDDGAVPLAAPQAGAAPPAAPVAAGTRFGNTLRRAKQSVDNAIVSGINAQERGSTDLLNTVTYPARALGGFVRDTYNGAMNNPASPNAGQPLSGLTAPQLALPYPRGGAASVPAATPANPAAPVPAVTSPVPSPAPVSRMPALRDFRGVQGSALPTAPATSGIDSGVTIGGRHLNYGAMVNGVPTFSNDDTPGSSIPRTMSNQTISDLGNRLQTAPAQTSALSSDVLGYTPSSSQVVAQNVAQLQRAQPITGSRPSAQQFADADRAAIASGDWRSADGTAAHNLGIDAAYGRTPRLRRIAEQQLAGMQAGATQGGLEAQQSDSQSQLVDQQGQNALEAENLRGQYGLAQARQATLNRPGQQVTLADGTLGLQDPVTGVVTQSKLATGAPARTLVSRDDPQARRTSELTDQLNKGVQEQMKSFLPSKDAPAPTPQMIAQWREQSAQAMGLRLGTDPKTGRRMVEINGQVMPL